MDLNQIAQKTMGKIHIKRYEFSWLSCFALGIHYSWRLTSLLPQPKIVYKRVYRSINLDSLQALLKKERLYRGLAQYHRGEFGFIGTDKCDSLLLSSLIACRKDFPVSLSMSRDVHGYFHRLPLSMPECYPERSKSSMSRDMMTGYAFYLAMTGQHAEASNTLSSLEENDYVMGIGDPSRLILMPTLEKLLAMISKDNTLENKMRRRMYTPLPKNLKGYQIKLDILAIMAIGHIQGGLTEKQMKSVRHYASTVPSCPLAMMLLAMYDSKYSLDETIALLNKEAIFPNGRLPTNRDRYVDWFWDAQNPEDLKPDLTVDIQELSGCDYLFYMWMLKHTLNIEA